LSEVNNENIYIFRTDASFRGSGKSSKVDEAAPELKSNIQDLRNNPTDYIGRSLVKKFDTAAFKGKTFIEVRNDIHVFAKNPGLVRRSEIVFGQAYRAGVKAGDKDAYGRAAAVQAAFVEEFKR
jgi:hypothetical protein